MNSATLRKITLRIDFIGHWHCKCGADHVFYTERGENIRIISARKATKHEQRTYYKGQEA